MPLVLASRSPRRREILGWLGVEFEVVEPDVEELTAGLDPEGLVLENARRKAAAGLEALGGAAETAVLGVDTDVFVDGEMLGQPADRAAAEERLRRLSGREHEVLSGLCLLGPRAAGIPGGAGARALGGGAVGGRVPRARRGHHRDAIWTPTNGGGGPADTRSRGSDRSWSTGVEGDFSNVVGLPVRLLLELDPALPVAARENPKANI